MTFVGVAKQNADVWDRLGGSKFAVVKSGSPIKADQKLLYSGAYYLHLTSPVSGWSKALWFDYKEIVTESLPPETVVTHTIDVHIDGKISVDGGPAF